MSGKAQSSAPAWHSDNLPGLDSGKKGVFVSRQADGATAWEVRKVRVMDV